MHQIKDQNVSTCSNKKVLEIKELHAARFTQYNINVKKQSWNSSDNIFWGTFLIFSCPNLGLSFMSSAAQQQFGRFKFWIFNICCNFFPLRLPAQNDKRYSIFKIQHNQIDELPRTSIYFKKILVKMPVNFLGSSFLTKKLVV